MVYIHAKYNGLIKAVCAAQKITDSFCNGLCAVVYDEVAVIILDVILPVLNFIAIYIDLANGWPPTLKVFVNSYTDNFIRSKKPVINALVRWSMMRLRS